MGGNRINRKAGFLWEYKVEEGRELPCINRMDGWMYPPCAISGFSKLSFIQAELLILVRPPAHQDIPLHHFPFTV